MFRHIQQFVIVVSLLTVVLVVLCGKDVLTAPAVKFVINPNEKEVYLGSGPIVISVISREKNLTFSWKLTGPGKLDGAGSAVFYWPPKKLDGVSQAVITVTVTDEAGHQTP